MPFDYFTAHSEFFRWILRETPENSEPMALNEMLKKYTTDRDHYRRLMICSSQMLSKMDKIEGFTVLQKIRILFLISKSPCQTFRIQMREAGEYKVNRQKLIQWFCSKDGTLKLERQEEPFRMSRNIQSASRFFRFMVDKRWNYRIPTNSTQLIKGFLRERARSKGLVTSVYFILNEGNLIEGFSLLESIHIFFLSRRPISEAFEEKIKEAGEYELDGRRRIIYYRSNDGSFERRDIWRNNDQDQPEEDGREEELEDMDLNAGNEMLDDSDQINIRRDLEHEGLDPEPMEDMDLDFEPEPREPTIQFENQHENCQARLAPEPISNELLEPAQNGPDVIPTFVNLAEPKDPAVKQELPEDLNHVKEEVEEQEAKPILVEPPSAIHLLTLVRNLIWTINSPFLNDLLRKVEVKMAKPGTEDIKIPFIDVEAAALHGLGSLFKSASAMISPDCEPVDLSQILYLFNLMLSMVEMPQDCSVFTKIEEFIREADDKKVSMEKVEFAIGCMVQAATLN